MFKTIGTDIMRKKMGEILDCVNLRGEEFIIERKEKPIVGLIPIKKLRALKHISKSYLLDFLQEGNSGMSDVEIEKIANDANTKLGIKIDTLLFRISLSSYIKTSFFN